MFQKTCTFNIVLRVRDFGDLARKRRNGKEKVLSSHQVTMISIAASWERTMWAAAWGHASASTAAD